MRFCAMSMLRISNAAVVPTGTDFAQPPGRPVGAKRGGVRQPFDARLQLHEGAEVRHARDATRPHLAHLVAWWPPCVHGSSRSCFSPSEIFCVASSTRSTFTVIWSPAATIASGVVDARPAHLGDMEQALDAAAQVHEGAEVEHRGDPTGEHRAGHDRLAHGRRARALLLLEVLAPGDDDGLSAVLVLDDAERVELAHVHRRVGGADDVDLRERTERALAGDAHLVAALDALLHLAFHGEPGPERVLELALRRGVAHALARQHDAAAGRDDHRLDAVADRHLDVAVGVLQLREVDLRPRSCRRR